MKVNILIPKARAIGVLAACLTALPVMAGNRSTDKETTQNSQSIAEKVQALPQVVQTTLQKEVGDQAIRKVWEQTTAAGTAYGVQLKAPAGPFWLCHPIVLIAPDGKILKEHFMPLTGAELEYADKIGW
jgi:hypothetical protein